jgi:CheY-like chemotaxis protein
LLTIVNDILDFSKIEAGKLDLEIVECDVRQLAEDVADLLAESAHRKGLELVTLLDPAVPDILRGDPGRLRQVLTNLVGNAIKFTETGTVELRVTCGEWRSTRGAGRGARDEYLEDQEPGDADRHAHPSPLAAHPSSLVTFEVHDTGIGIPSEAGARLFQAFAQADGSTTRRYGGTGLGLTISRQLVELMGGQMGLESDVGQGSTFWFTVPLESVTSRRKPARRAPADLAGTRVLIVDDNQTSRTMLACQLTSWKLAVTSVTDGPSALALLQTAATTSQPYTLAILDTQMPGMDGLTLARTLKHDPSLANLPLVLLTRMGMHGRELVDQSFGVAVALAKPIRQSQLLEALRAALRGSSMGSPELSLPAPVLSEPGIVPGAGGRARVLVVEDNPVNQRVAVRMLARLGLGADVASDGREAVQSFSRQPYALVLMDCQMPELDGFQATARIRASEGDGPRTPIIAMTASAMRGDRERCLAAGMDDYISKPVRIDDLRLALERWLPAASSKQTSLEQTSSK